jgi:DnaK suppressor protein
MNSASSIAADAIALNRDSHMKSQSRAPQSTPRKPSVAASRTAKHSQEAKPRNASTAPNKSNGHGKTSDGLRAKTVATKSLVAKAGPTKAQKAVKSLPKNAAQVAVNGKAKAVKAAKATSLVKPSTVAAGSAKSKAPPAKASAARNRTDQPSPVRGRKAQIDVKLQDTKSRAGTAAQANGHAQNGKTTGKSNGAGPHRANGTKRNGVKTPITELPIDYRPSDSEPFMGDLQRLYFRRKLLAWRDEILRSTKETLQSLHDDQAHYADIADRATSESDKALELRARDRQRKLIAKIEAAIERIDRGTYGYCDETGEPIAVRRLDARPIATLSIEAQERHERRERVYRDD